MPRDLFSNRGSTTVSSGGTTAPSAGATESWTVASSTSFPAASNSASPVTQFYVADTALQSELILVTNVSGTTWSVTRGADGTTPVAHTTGFTVRNVVPSTWLQELEDRISMPSFNVLEYGADKTGVADSTSAITAAITAAGTFASSYKCAKVVIPPGSYLIQGSVVFGSSQSNIVIEAYGAYIYGGTDYHTTGQLMFNAGGSTGYTTGPSNVTVLGGVWDAKGQSCPASTSGQGDYQHRDIWCFGNGKNWRFEDMTFRNVPSWHGIDANSVDGLVIRNCRFEGFVDKSELGTRGDSEAIQLDTGGGGDPCINVCVVDCYSGPPIDGSGLTLAPGKLVGSHTPSVANTANHTKIRVANNYINTSGGAAIQGYDWDGATITGNIIESPGGDGIKIYGNSLGVVNRIVITGNIINSPSARGIYCSSSGGDGSGNGFKACVINGNTVTGGSSSAAIEVQAFNDSVVQGNQVSTLSTGHGIYARTCTDILIGNNSIHGTSAMTAGSGIQADSGTRNHIQGNKVYEVANHGIWTSGVHNDSVMEDNFVFAAGRATSTWYAINVGASSCVNPVVTGNLIRKFGSGNEVTNAVRVTSGSTGVVQYGNDYGGLGQADAATSRGYEPGKVYSATTTTSGTLTTTSYTATMSSGGGTNPALTMNTDTSVLVTLTMSASHGTAGSSVYAGVAVSGASTVAAADTAAVRWTSAAIGAIGTLSASFVLTGLTAGSNTFTMNMKVATGTGTYAMRSMMVQPL